MRVHRTIYSMCLLLLTMLLQTQLSMAQSTLRGQVTDTAGTPLHNVSVTLKNTSQGSATDQLGNFTLNAPTGSILVFSMVGYEKQEFTVTSSQQINIRLLGIAGTSEVVVTALGIRKEKKALGFATQEVKGDALTKAREPQVINGLAGRVAGLTITTATTLFENSGMSLRGRTPLVVIDGIPTRGDTWNLNPDDIENINVLKGNAAALLYGSLGINGALQITTKKGKAGANGVQVTLNQSFQTNAGYIRIPETQKDYGMGWGGYYAFINGKGGGGWYDDYGYVWGPKLNQKDATTESGWMEVPQYNSPYEPNTNFSFTQNGSTGTSNYKPIPWISRGQDNLKNFLQNQLLSTTNVNIEGKNDNGEYRISVSHMYQKGQIPNTKLNSSTLNLAGGLKLNDKLRIDANISYNRQYSPNYPTSTYGQSNMFYNIVMWMGPDVDVRDLRNYWQPGGGRTSGTNFIPYGVEGRQQFNYNYTWYNNPWYLAYENLRAYTNDVVNAQASMNYNIAKGLNLVVRTGGTINNAFNELKTPYSFVGNDLYGQYSRGESSAMLYTTDALLTYKKKLLNNDLDLTANISGSNRYVMTKDLNSTTVGGLTIPNYYNLAASRDPATTSNSKTERETRSLFGYVDLGYKRMVYLNVSLRNDWSSSIPKPNNSFLYPSASASVIVSEMVKMPTVISFAKIRGNFGSIYSDFSPYSLLPVYSTGSRWNGTPSLSLPSSLITPGLKPNQTVSKEIGAEMRFLKNRVGFDFTYFTNLDQYWVRDVPVSQASGYSSLRVNADKTTRSGIEIVFTGSPIHKKDFSWDVTLNFSTMREKIKEYYNGVEIRDGVKVGDRTDTYRGWGWEKSPDGKVVYNATTGMPKYIDHQVNLGFSGPDWVFGISNEIRYKAFRFSFLIDGRVGGLLYNGVERKLYEGGQHVATANSYRDDAYEGKKTYVGDGVVVTAGSVEYDIQGKIVSDTRKFAPNTTGTNYVDWVFDYYTNGIDEPLLTNRTFVKLREVMLEYNVPTKLVSKTPFKAISISLVGRNLAIFSKVKYMDPDGYSGLVLPEPSYRNVGVNLNVKF